jgi:hypothetical protein
LKEKILTKDTRLDLLREELMELVEVGFRDKSQLDTDMSTQQGRDTQQNKILLLLTPVVSNMIIKETVAPQLDNRYPKILLLCQYSPTSQDARNASNLLDCSRLGWLLDSLSYLLPRPCKVLRILGTIPPFTVIFDPTPFRSSIIAPTFPLISPNKIPFRRIMSHP